MGLGAGSQGRLRLFLGELIIFKAADQCTSLMYTLYQPIASLLSSGALLRPLQVNIVPDIQGIVSTSTSSSHLCFHLFERETAYTGWKLFTGIEGIVLYTSDLNVIYQGSSGDLTYYHT